MVAKVYQRKSNNNLKTSWDCFYLVITSWHAEKFIGDRSLPTEISALKIEKNHPRAEKLMASKVYQRQSQHRRMRQSVTDYISVGK